MLLATTTTVATTTIAIAATTTATIAIDFAYFQYFIPIQAEAAESKVNF